MREPVLRLRSLLYLLGVVVIAVVSGAASGAHAQGRIALVIGNSTYTKVPSLRNPVHDSEDVAGALRRLGFTVTDVKNADFNAFRRALLDFNRAAPASDIAVIYFAGHGIEVDGENWMLPTDVELRNDVDASSEAVSLRAAMQAVGTARSLGIVILDACRNNPFQATMQRSAATRRVVLSGLAPIEPAANVLVAYAARDGTVADDGAGSNSPFTAALLRHIETPGLEIDFLFRNVRDDVKAATGNEQQPFVYGSLSSREIYLKPGVPGTAAAAPPADAAEIAWSFLKATGDIATLGRFIDRFPTSPHVADARLRIASLQAAPVPATGGTELVARRANYVNQMNGTGEAEFESAEAAVARRFLHETPAVEEAWTLVRESADHAMIRRFVDQFPTPKRRATADQRLTELGQRPITVKVTPYRPLNVPESVFDAAARDPDVLECYRVGDQNDVSCQRALQRYPDIARFNDNVHFLLSFCEAMGKSTGCVPSVRGGWNFPIAKGDGSPAGTAPVAAISGSGSPPKEDARELFALPPGSPGPGAGSPGPGKEDRFETHKLSQGSDARFGSHRFARGEDARFEMRHGARDGDHAGRSVGSVHNTLKSVTAVTPSTVPKSTNIKTPNVRLTTVVPTTQTPNVKVNVNVRVPNVSVHIR